MSGKLIVIEGLDGSGKATQSKLLYESLLAAGKPVRKVSFPDYESNSSSLVKMYLSGEFGKNAEDVSPYIASTFFAADRYASYKTKWEKYYLGNGIIIADRYTTSNMVHQASKISDIKEKSQFLDWLYDLEYNKLNLPEPDLVIFLDMPVENARQLMKDRANKINNSSVKDIHESNDAYLQQSYDNACFVAEKYGWKRIKCAQNGKVRSIDDIADEIYNEVKNVL